MNTNTETPGMTFKWIRGELLRRTSYGAPIYAGLISVTGEMMVVIQAEMQQEQQKQSGGGGGGEENSNSREANVLEAIDQEVEILKELDHPNIVQYLGFEMTPRYKAVFLEYATPMTDILGYGRLDENKVVKSFTSQILGGLEYLHSKGIVHRDLKGDNVLVDKSGICKISGFGLSRHARQDDTQKDPSTGTTPTRMHGTVFWMAPEVVDPRSKGYDVKVDIWSLGCVLVEMWTGKRPWIGEEMVAVMFKLYASKLPPPIPEDIVLSELAEDFRKQCFVINPNERPSAAQLRTHGYLEISPSSESESD